MKWKFGKISKVWKYYDRECSHRWGQSLCRIQSFPNPTGNFPTNTPRGFHVETTWKRSFARRFNVESTWCVCRLGDHGYITEWIAIPVASQIYKELIHCGCNKERGYREWCKCQRVSVNSTELCKYAEAVLWSCSVEKVFLEISQKFCGPATLFKKRPWPRCFPMNFAKFLRTPFFTEHLWWLVLNMGVTVNVLQH